MQRVMTLAACALLATTNTSMGQLQRENCRTQGQQFHVDQNSKITLDTVMDENGCRYTYSIAENPANPHARFTATVFEKAVIMKEPANGALSQSGEFSFFYKPNRGFKGKDSFVVYVCGSTQQGAGCARLTYNATIK